MSGEAWDVLHSPGEPDQHWTTDNVGEAAPGVLTPLSWSVWGDVGDRMTRGVCLRMGVFSAADHRDYPRIVRPFYGRLALRVEYLATVGDRAPGASGPDVVANMFGRVPDTMTFAPTLRRYPVIAGKLPWAMVAAPRRVRRWAPLIDAWWRASVARLPELPPEECVRLLSAAVRRFDETLTEHSLALLAAVQPTLVALTKLVERAGVGDVGALSGTGGAEMAIIGDMWQASRGARSIADVVANHGFHGPLEGEMSSRVWREDPAPLERMIAGYAARPDHDNPVAREQRARAELPRRQREVLAAVPAARRPAARMLLGLAARLLPLRGVGKRSYLQSLDVARGAARRLGEHLADQGRIEGAEDVFHLTLDELTGDAGHDFSELAGRRRQRWSQYRTLSIPNSWRGTPQTSRVEPSATGERGLADPLTGIGASAGVAEGIVRVVRDPSFADVADGEVLVATTTDPSWASIMFLSAALVVDIGGPLSHAAVVARELGIPCVVNTRTGSHVLRTGDRVRVDGSRGTVEVLQRAPVPPAAADERSRSR